MMWTKRRLWVWPAPFLRKTSPPYTHTQSFMDNEVKEQGFTDSLLGPTGLRWDAAALFFSRFVPAWIPTTRAFEGDCGGRGNWTAARGCGGGSGWAGLRRLRLDVGGVVAGCLRTFLCRGWKGGGGRRLLEGFDPWRRDAVDHVRMEGCDGGDGGGGSNGCAWGGGGGVWGGSICWLRDGFWWREVEEARNGWMTEHRWKCWTLFYLTAVKPQKSHQRK